MGLEKYRDSPPQTIPEWREFEKFLKDLYKEVDGDYEILHQRIIESLGEKVRNQVYMMTGFLYRPENYN